MERTNYTPLQAREAGFDRNKYAAASEGEFTGALVMKIYGDFCIRCYFLTDEGYKVKLTAWQNRRTGHYGPRWCGVDFKDISLLTRWRNRVGLSRTGKPTWIEAEELA